MACSESVKVEMTSTPEVVPLTSILVASTQQPSELAVLQTCVVFEALLPARVLAVHEQQQFPHVLVSAQQEDQRGLSVDSFRSNVPLQLPSRL